MLSSPVYSNLTSFLTTNGLRPLPTLRDYGGPLLWASHLPPPRPRFRPIFRYHCTRRYSSCAVRLHNRRIAPLLTEHFYRCYCSSRLLSPHSRPSARLPKNISKMPFRQRVARHFVDTLSPTAPYLSYHDILLTGDDIKALKYDWLTDSNIAFWEEWLEREILPKYPRAKIVLLRPSMTFLLMQAVDVKSIGSALPDFRHVTHIFLPVNDARDGGSADGGSHWSLLVVSTIDRLAFHYDSLGGANLFEAQKCTDRLSKVLGRPLKFMQIDPCPQQENSNDCGVFVCILMRHLLIKRLLNANASEKVDMRMENQVVDSHGGRKEMLKIIESLRKEGERRRSLSPFPSSDTPPRIE